MKRGAFNGHDHPSFSSEPLPCRYSGLVFKDGDIWEIDHIVAKSLGGPNTLGNSEVLHRHCPDQRHAELAKAGINLN
jgi:RNA-directed DNA polymerase